MKSVMISNVLPHYLEFQEVLVVLDGLYLDPLFVLLALVFLG